MNEKLFCAVVAGIGINEVKYGEKGFDFSLARKERTRCLTIEAGRAIFTK